MIAKVSIAALALSIAGPAYGADPWLAALSPGMSIDSARAALSKSGATWLDQTRDGALAEGLVRTALLETLNRFELAPRDATKALDAAAFREIATLERDGRRYALAFGDAKGGRVLRYLLVRIPVPVDTADPSPRRLRRLREALDELERTGFALQPKSKDRYGNTFIWTAGGSKGSLRVIYLPESDELRALFTD